jgi:hypothetical protein
MCHEESLECIALISNTHHPKAAEKEHKHTDEQTPPMIHHPSCSGWMEPKKLKSLKKTRESYMLSRLGSWHFVATTD